VSWLALLASSTLAASPGAAADSLPWALVAAGPAIASADARSRLAEPSGIAVDAFGRLYVSDASLHCLKRYDARGAWLGESGSLGSDPGQLRRPGGVALLGTLSVAVLDLENRRVESYDLFGRRLGTLIDLLGPDVDAAVGRVDPVAIAADRGGALFLADRDGERVLAFDFSGRLTRVLGGLGARPGSFRGLSGVAAGPRGELVAAERVNARAQRMDAGGRALASWPLDVRPGRGALPVAVDDSARTAIADESAGRLWVFDRSGRVLAALQGLEGPRALAFARDGSLLVGEARSGQVRRFTLERTARLPAAGEE
jgi:sugar lactone lactonase YvrE